MASWLARREDVRTQFELLAWVPLGQTPNMDKCQELLHLQLTAGELSKSAGPEERREKLQQAMSGRSGCPGNTPVYNFTVCVQFYTVCVQAAMPIPR